MNEEIRLKNFNGELHCEIGPAIFGAWDLSWFINGERHREDGPALICSFISFYISGKKIE